MMCDALNMGLVSGVSLTGMYGMPEVKADTVDAARLSLTESLIPFNMAKTCQRRNTGVHFFIDDYQFERVWRSPQIYINMLGRYRFVCAPDFSLYLNMPMAAKIWNVYRSRMIAAYWQSRGLHVVPTLQWAEPETWKFCFDGIEPGGTVAVSTLGAAKHRLSRQIWIAGMREAIKRLRPDIIILYGTPIDFNYGHIKVAHFTNEILERRMNCGR